MTLNLRTITAAIKALSITGVTIKDVDEIPTALSDRTVHYLYPTPHAFLPAGATVTVDTMGTNSGAYKTIRYTLGYTFAYEPIDTGAAGWFENYALMVDMALLILDTLMNNDDIAGAIDMQPSLGAFGIVYDASGNQYHGCAILLAITEFWEV